MKYRFLLIKQRPYASQNVFNFSIYADPRALSNAEIKKGTAESSVNEKG